MYSYGWAPQTQRDQKFAGPSQELRVAVTAPPPPNSTGDGTAVDDGWGVFSGTSAAAPQLAGVCALLLAKNQSLTPADVKAVLRRSARSVLVGHANPSSNDDGNPMQAGPGDDGAAGAGLVDAFAAWQQV